MSRAASIDDLSPVWAGQIAVQETRPPALTTVHDFMALAYFTRGSAIVHQRERFEVSAGEVYLVPAGERHGFVSARSPAAWGVGFYPACFAATEIALLLAPFERAAAGGSKVVRVTSARQEHLVRLCEELHRETATRAPAAHVDLVARSLLGLILVEIARATTLTPATGTQSGIVGEALRFIERHCLGPISLGDVAAFVRRSPSHVSTAVHRATGRTVRGWVIAGRLSEARNRLQHTDELVDVIAERVGYADPTHFIRLFRRAHGSTPAAWRAQRRSAVRGGHSR